jgi:hypothetical protein
LDSLGIGKTGGLVDLLLFNIFIVAVESLFEEMTLVVLGWAVGDRGDAGGSGDSLFRTGDGGSDGGANGLAVSNYTTISGLGGDLQP